MAFGRARRFVAVGLLFTLLAACGSESEGDSGSGDGDQGGERATVRLVLSSGSLGFGMVYTAIEGGHFDDFGIDVEIIETASSGDTLAVLLSGDAEVLGGGSTATMIAAARGQDLRYIANGYGGFVTSMVVRKEVAEKMASEGIDADSPVEERIKAIEGETVGLTSAASSVTQMVNSVAADAGVKFETVFMNQTEMPAALARGDIAAYGASGPYDDLAILEDAGVLWVNGPDGEWPGTSPNFLQQAYTVRADWLEDNADVAARFVAALIAATEFIKADPAAAGDLVQARFSDIDPELFAQSWERNADAFTRWEITTEGFDEARVTVTGDDVPPELEDLRAEDIVATDVIEQAQTLYEEQS